MSWQFYNPNPYGKLTGDCVIRALTLALGKRPFGQMLTMPEFGYVEQALPNTYVADNIVPKYAPVIQAETYEKLPLNGVFLFTASSLSYNVPILLPANEPKIIYRDDRLLGDAFVFVLK